MLRGLHHYLEIERDALVARKVSAGVYRDGDWVAVKSWGRSGVTKIGHRRATAHKDLEIEERQRLLVVDEYGRPQAPLWLWLGDDGEPLSRSTWQAVFRRASDRCAAFGLDLVAFPHKLRHTFAVHMLGLLLRQTVRALRMEAGETLMSQQVKRLLVGDPLRKLQLLMGHSRRETTLLYLDVLDEAQEIVVEALQAWDQQAEQAAALARVQIEDEQGAAA